MNHPPPDRRYLIIGAGVTGIAAAQAIRAMDASAQITLISDDPFGYYSRPGLAYYLTGELDEKTLFPLQKKDLANLNLRWLQGRVTRIEPQEHAVVLEDGARLPYDRLLIATGSLAAPLTTPGADSQGVHKLDSLQDARALLQTSRRARTAVVVGGGITALELVEGLRAQKISVHYLLRGERYWNNVLDESESRIVEDRLQHDGVTIHYQTELAEIQTHKGRVAGVITRDRRRLPCDMVAYAIGVRPRLDLARTANLQVDRGIITDQTLQTSAADIYAAGDVAQVFDLFSGRSVLDTLWSIARLQGHAAGLNMAGNETLYQKSVPLNVTRLAGLTTTIIGTVGSGTDPSLVGIARGDSETWRQLPDTDIAETEFETNRLRLVVGEQHLLGAVVMGDQALSLPLQDLIGQRTDITLVRDALLRPDQMGETIIALWQRLRSGHAQ